MERVILHSDMNNFYASVECLYNPLLRDKPLAVGSQGDSQYGIILAKNYIAKKYKIGTGDAIWEAKRKCPQLVVVPANFRQYMRFSKMAIDIYKDYTDKIESFGLDECWLDVTQSTKLFGDGEIIANEIRDRMKKELGVTVSVGVSFNKIFAKLGSDMKKPDATTIIKKENFKDKIWKLPVEDLLNVGRSTKTKFLKYNINTIGDLANTKPEFLKKTLGKRGVELWSFANGYDNSLVSFYNSSTEIKSIGNSITLKRNLTTDEEVKIVLYKLIESVTERLRKHGFVCSTVQITIRDETLASYERQGQLIIPCHTTNELFNKAFELFKIHHQPFIPIRKLGVRACNLSTSNYVQLSFGDNFKEIEKHEKIDNTIDKLRYRFGHYAVQRGISLVDTELSHINPIDDHVLHPTSYR
ncbi:DNA polymerase IV [Metaclostridioides mangenotii]|uniref:DNA polymerase IV n=1 Tax=Metaclostridioides mangenotii TaxID=1540 RepID=UPI0004858859|nr:DNA polymerase IV [Clostridioides mangenotii]